MLQKEISAVSCRDAPPPGFPEITLGPKSAPICACAPPLKSMPYPGLNTPVDTLFVMFVEPMVEKLPCEAKTPDPPLLLMFTGPAQAATPTNELPPIFMPPPALWSNAPLAPIATSDIPPTRKPTPAFPLLEQVLSETPLLLETEIPSPPAFVTLSP